MNLVGQRFSYQYVSGNN